MQQKPGQSNTVFNAPFFAVSSTYKILKCVGHLCHGMKNLIISWNLLLLSSAQWLAERLLLFERRNGQQLCGRWYPSRVSCGNMVLLCFLRKSHKNCGDMFHTQSMYSTIINMGCSICLCKIIQNHVHLSILLV